MRKTDSHANRPLRARGAVALVAAGFALILTGCGFQPLYGAKSGAKQSASVTTMAAIDVAPITDRAGQVLRNELLDRITPRGTPRQPTYRLDVALEETVADVVILRDSTSTVSKYTATATWVLTDVATSAPIVRGSERRVTSFPLTSSEFASLEAERSARNRTMAELAEDIRLRLGLFFSRGS